MSTQNSIQILQAYASGLAVQSQQHKLQSKVFAAKGLAKIASKYAEHSVEEMGWVDKFLDRIIALGGEVRLDASPAVTVVADPVEFIKADLKVSEREVPILGKAVLSVAEDLASFDLLKGYYLDEEEDMAWMRQELALVGLIGKENWILEQL